MEIIWTFAVGEILVLKIEPTNRHYIHAVAIYKVLKLRLAPRMSAFLMIENKVFAEITGAKVYRVAGSGSPMCLPSMDLTFMLTK